MPATNGPSPGSRAASSAARTPACACRCSTTDIRRRTRCRWPVSRDDGTWRSSAGVSALPPASAPKQRHRIVNPTAPRRRRAKCALLSLDRFGERRHGTNESRRWDIFCRVVDNYRRRRRVRGDSRASSAAEHASTSRLFVDVWRALARIAPEVDARRRRADGARRSGARWTANWSGLPRRPRRRGDRSVRLRAAGAYLAAMARARPPAGVDQSRISVGRAVDRRHATVCRRRHPQRPLTRNFYFPGLHRASGGLLREPGCSRGAMHSAPTPRARAAFWQRWACCPPADSDGRFAFLLRRPGIARTARSLGRRRSTRSSAWCPKAWPASELDRWPGGAVPPRADEAPRQPDACRVPFVAQDDYDRLLWACDLNFVRGEDSFVRAQWAARPLIWQRIRKPKMRSW